MVTFMAKISNIIQQRFAIFTFYTRIHFEHWIPSWQRTGRRMEGPVSWVTCYKPECSVVTFWVGDGLGIMGTEGWVVNGRALLLMDWLNSSLGSAALRDHLNLRSSLSHLQHALNKKKSIIAPTNTVYSEIIIIDIMYCLVSQGAQEGK